MIRKITVLFGLASVLLLFTSSTIVNAQCLSENDDLSIVEDTDLYSIQDFNVELFHILFPTDPLKNFVFSPYSVWNALVLGYFGSAGETQRQFEKVLRVHDKISTLRKWRQLEYMYMRREETSVNNTFVLSNRAYFDESVQVRRCMQNILHNEILQLQLRKDPQTSTDIINKFVSERTRGHIKELVNAMDIESSHMVLVNAAYFKGTWKNTFNKSSTTNMPFNTLTGQTLDVPMMVQFGEYRWGYDANNEFEYLELPYAGDSVAMYIYLPYTNTVDNFKKMVGSITPASIDSNLSNMRSSLLTVFFPKFSIDTAIEEELLKAVYKLGLTDAFIAYKANFTDFSFNRNLKLDHSIHKAFIQVNEEGTEAAAATAFLTTKIGGSSEFICNKPFVFMIRDNKTKNILFIGTFQSPSKSRAPQPSTNSNRDQASLGVQGNRRRPQIILSQEPQNVPYQPPSLSPIERLRPGNRDDNRAKDVYSPEAIEGSIEENPSLSREQFLPGVRENNKPKNVFQPEAFQGSVADISRRPSNFSPRDQFSPNENDKTNNKYPSNVVPIQTTEIQQQQPSYSPVDQLVQQQQPSYSSVDRLSPDTNEKPTPLVRVPLESTSQSQNLESPIKRFFTYFPFKRYLSDAKERSN